MQRAAPEPANGSSSAPAGRNAAPADPATPEIDTLARSGLFLPTWYAARYAPAGNPLLAFCQSGWRAGHMPNPYFDTGWYRAAYTDVAAAGINPLLHYVRHGEQEGRRPILFFDPGWYRQAHDVAPGQNCLAHFLRHRLTGAATPVPEFDPVPHLRQHPHLAERELDPFLDARSATASAPPPDAEIITLSGLFDATFYLVGNPDVREARCDPLAHYCRDGWQESRNPNLYFLTDWYAANAGCAPIAGNPLVHYYLHGERAGFRPAPWFDPAWYSAYYGLPVWQSALRHYLAHRRGQRHSPNADFDLIDHACRFAGEIGPNRDVFAHHLRRNRHLWASALAVPGP